MKNTKQSIISLLGSAGLVFVTAQPLHAGSSWLSTVTTIENEVETTQMASTLSSSEFAAGITSTTSVFNITISLEENPSGDSIYPDDSGTSDDEQNKFERKIEEYSDAVFQMTNGKHKIGTVTIFRGAVQWENADVQWTKDCPKNLGPRAFPSGFGVPGKQIFFCTTWPGYEDKMDTPDGAGFTLAHEWGHYAYGLYDEYASSCLKPGETDENKCRISSPRSTDTRSVPSIMNHQWNATEPGQEDWLEFSTDGVEPYNTQSDGDDKNAHARVFEENAWLTLTRDPKTDPRHDFLPSRTQYTNLVAPTTSDLTVNDDESTARSELKIVWAGDQVIELMIDTSGSMSGAPINNAKTAAKGLVGQLSLGENAVGVGRFSSSATQTYPITDIPDPDTGVILAAQTAIDGFSAGGGTNIEGAALRALAEVQGFQNGTRPSVVFLLTDGKSSVDVSNVVSQYTAARVPLITFGFGSGVDAALLQNLANNTGGQYFFSPTSLAQIQQAFAAANAAFSSNVVVASSTSTVMAGTIESRSLPLDSTLASTSINVTYELSETDISLRLLDSMGTDTGQTFICTASSEVSCEAQVDVQSLGAGEYNVEITNNSGGDKDVSILVSGDPSTIDNFDIAVEIDNIVYPNSFSIVASISKGAALSGLDVFAKITKPDNTTIDVLLLDNGLNSDQIADDGFYSVDVPYDQNGNYTVVVTASNASGGAQTTFEGLAISVGEDGTTDVPQPININENFTRVAVVNATVTNFQTDDHSDDASDPTMCTPIADDNIDTVGRIDSAGDVDCFFFSPTDLNSDLIVRATSLRENIQPVVRIYDASGIAELMTADLSTSLNSTSGVILTIQSALLNATRHVVTVEHADSSISGGGYALSAGAKLASDGDGPGPVGEAPTTPGGFRYAIYSDTAAELFWNRSTDDGVVVGYDIVRNGVLVETRDAASYFDDSLSPGVEYTYEITAVDDDGNRSPTDTLNFTAGGNHVPTAPNVPPGFRYAVYSDTAAELFWIRSTDDSRVVGYEITRDGVLVETRDATSFYDDSLSPGITYTYRIVAVDDEGNKSGSSTVSFTTGGNPAPEGNPSVPTGFRSAVYSSTAAELFWTRSTDDDGVVVSYELTRNGVLVETRDASSYFDDSLSPGTTYVYTIIAVDNEGNRSPSNTLSFTTD